MIQLIGIPFDANSSFLKGPSFAPQRIRLMETEGSANAFSENGTEIAESINYTDLGDMFFESTKPKDVFKVIKTEIAELLEVSGKVMSIGGDHSITYPIISAFTDKYPNLNVLHLDAHADLYDDFDDNPYSHASPFARIMEGGKVRSPKIRIAAIHFIRFGCVGSCLRTRHIAPRTRWNDHPPSHRNYPKYSRRNRRCRHRRIQSRQRYTQYDGYGSVQIDERIDGENDLN